MQKKAELLIKEDKYAPSENVEKADGEFIKKTFRPEAVPTCLQ